MPLAHLSDHRKGLLLTAIGGLALSMDIPLVRLAEGDIWSILGMRSVATVLAALIILIGIRLFSGKWPVLIPGRPGVVAGLLYGISSLTFVLAVFNTATANVVFIVAFNPMFGALLSWLFLKERPKPATLIAMLFMIFGVGLIVNEGLSSGHVFGDAMALLSALILAAAITVGRASRREMGFVPLLAAILPAALGLTQILPSGLSITHPGWILFNGAILMPVANMAVCPGCALSRHWKWGWLGPLKKRLTERRMFSCWQQLICTELFEITPLLTATNAPATLRLSRFSTSTAT